MRIAVEGCAHGELEIIYNTLVECEKVDGKKVDLLLCCGDFQATRNWQDLKCMAVPDKYKDMGTFYKYYSGEKVAPVLTIFIGGNHEASNHLQELPYGGWVAPNIYYLGYAGVVSVAGVRIAGLSGIYKSQDLMRGHHEFPPYTESTIRSAYHIRNLEIYKLKQLSGKIDIFMTHDWPSGITEYGNVNALLRKKPFFKDDIENDSLGSPPAMELLKKHYPSHWFAAHLHCQFAAMVPKENDSKVTKFLALDKCLPRRKFLQIVEIEHDCSLPIELSYDLEWLTILSLTNHLLSIKNSICYMPGPGLQGRWIFTPTEEEKEHIHHKFNFILKVPLNFIQSVKSYKAESPNQHISQPHLHLNNQTTELCNKLFLDDPFALLKIANGITDVHKEHVTIPFQTSTPRKDIDYQVDTSNLTEENEISMFIVDKEPSVNPLIMTPLKLPAVKNESTIFIEEEASSLKEKETNSSKSPRSFSDMQDNTLSTTDTKTEPNFKKFKRRNQSIYVDNECIT